jgi:hypothetical protein
MGEVNEAALIVPDVFTVHRHGVAHRKRHPFPDVDVVGHQDRLRPAGETEDETLMRSRRPRVIGEEPRDRALRGDLELRAMLGERALDRGVLGDRSTAAHAGDGAEDERAKSYARSRKFRRRPAATSSASAMTTTTAMRRKSFVTYPRSHAAARSRPGEGAPTARDVPVRDA